MSAYQRRPVIRSRPEETRVVRRRVFTSCLLPICLAGCVTLEPPQRWRGEYANGKLRLCDSGEIYAIAMTSVASAQFLELYFALGASPGDPLLAEFLGDLRPSPSSTDAGTLAVGRVVHLEKGSCPAPPADPAA
jgi:hypothetical protein